VIQVTPKDVLSADILAVDDDPRMYDEIPADTGGTIGLPTDPIEIHVSEDTGPINMRTLAGDNDYVGLSAQQVTIIIDEGVVTGPIVRGTWPTDYMPILVVRGTVDGADGVQGTPGAPGMGAANGGPGGPGSPGGPALDARSGPLSLDDSAGSLRGGRGGGGGGGGGGGAFYQLELGSPETGSNLVTVNLAGGSSDSRAAGGTNGSPGALGPYGGPGDAGTPGGSGVVTSSDGASGVGSGGPAGSGGAGGKAILGITNITRVGATGTEIGGTA